MVDFVLNSVLMARKKKATKGRKDEIENDGNRKHLRGIGVKHHFQRERVEWDVIRCGGSMLCGY